MLHTKAYQKSVGINKKLITQDPFAARAQITHSAALSLSQAITNLGKVFTTEGGQVYIYSTVNGSSLDNTQVTVVGTAADVAYMDALSDTDNTDY